MRVLVPHLRSYYSFLDFSAAAARGGATALMEVVKAFAGARLVSRLVAIFDNDAVGRDAGTYSVKGITPTEYSGGTLAFVNRLRGVSDNWTVRAIDRQHQRARR